MVVICTPGEMILLGERKESVFCAEIFVSEKFVKIFKQSIFIVYLNVE